MGTVYLVGAGPGDPALLTLRAAELLRSVRMLAHDLLVPEPVLSMARPDAVRWPVGRRHGDAKISYRVHPKVVELARQGHDVLRIKCGDPMVFGRGGEEAQALRELGIPFQIVPGISAALGAASYAGISLTHREFASDCVFATGHGAVGPDKTQSNWDSLGQSSGTLALYMSLRRARVVLAKLVTHGRDPSTPAALVFRASRPDQEVLMGTVSNLADLARGMDDQGPAMLLVGQTVRLHAEIGWSHACPLLGSRILVARARAGSSRIASDLRRLGASVVQAPQLVSQPCLRPGQLSAFLGAPTQPRAQLLLWGDEQSVHAARTWIEASVKHGQKGEWVALDHRSARALTAMKCKDLTVLPGATPSTLAPHLSRWSQKKAHLLMQRTGRPHLELWLSQAGVELAWLGVHSLHPFWPSDVSLKMDALVLPSSSSARSLLSSPYAKDWRQQTPVVVFGEKTAKEARTWGIEKVVVVAPGEAAQACAHLLGSQTVDSGKEQMLHTELTPIGLPFSELS